MKKSVFYTDTLGEKVGFIVVENRKLRKDGLVLQTVSWVNFRRILLLEADFVS